MRPLIERLEAAGAVLVGALNMGEYAYDFTGENVHDGPSRNPHDLTRMTGGSSGGSGGAVGGGLVPLALGSDTNGSIRVPSSFCGIFGLKPTYGRLSRARTFPFVASFDHLGPFARSGRATSRSPMTRCRAPMPRTRPASTGRSSRSSALLERGIDGLRIAVAGGYFQQGPVPGGQRGGRARRQGARTSRARSNCPKRSARARPPMSSPRPKARRCISIACARARTISIRRCATGLIAGAMIPAPLVDRGAEIPPLVSRRRCSKLFERGRRDHRAGNALHRADASARQTFVLDGVELPVRANIGIYTQPISFIGLPVVGRAGAADADADRRADHRGAVAGGHRACASPMRWRQAGVAAAPRRGTVGVYDMEIDLPEVVAEVSAAFDRYEKALTTNDVAVLDELFRNDPRTHPLRHAAKISTATTRSQAFRAARSPVGLMRRLRRTVITTYGRDTRGGLDAVLSRHAAGQGRAADADLGALSGRLARSSPRMSA